MASDPRPHRVGCTKPLGRGYDILCGGCGDEVAGLLGDSLRGKLYRAEAALSASESAREEAIREAKASKALERTAKVRALNAEQGREEAIRERDEAREERDEDERRLLAQKERRESAESALAAARAREGELRGALDKIQSRVRDRRFPVRVLDQVEALARAALASTGDAGAKRNED